MRELSPWAARSNGREQHRERYAAYMKSPDWWRRRHQWAEEELRLASSPDGIKCFGCSRLWRLSQDDLHHVTYDRLGHEDHEDLWPLCRGCHTLLHDLLASTGSWRKLSRRLGNQLAIGVLRDTIDGLTAAPLPRGAAAALGDYL